MIQIFDDPIEYSKNKFYRSRTSLPDGLEIGDVELGKGSNNRVIESFWNDEQCAIRIPRRKSDTQQKGAATWELRHTLKASQLGASPCIYDAWYAKHATQQFPSGLYLVTECFAHNLEDMFLSRSNRSFIVRKSDDIADSISRSLWKLALSDMFLYDLKPSNIVVNVDEEHDIITTKIIDFGREFCEWAGTGEKDACTPIIDMVTSLVEGNVEKKAHILFACMLIQLAAITTYHLSIDRHRHRMDREMRHEINGIARAAATLIESMQGCNLRIVRQVLRSDPVKGVLSHYLGRRNSGTGRTLRLAKGTKPET